MRFQSLQVETSCSPQAQAPLTISSLRTIIILERFRRIRSDCSCRILLCIPCSCTIAIQYVFNGIAIEHTAREAQVQFQPPIGYKLCRRHCAVDALSDKDPPLPDWASTLLPAIPTPGGDEHTPYADQAPYRSWSPLRPKSPFGGRQDAVPLQHA